MNAVGTALRPYLAVVSARYRVLLQYRVAALAGFGTQVFWAGIRLMVLAAFYASTRSTPPMSLTDVVVYVWLGQALLATLPVNVDGDLAAQIRSGAVAHELCRPVDLYAFWFARTLAFRAAATSLRAAMMSVFAFGVLPLCGLGDWALSPPASGQAAIAFALSLAAAVLLSTAITMLMHVGLLFTLSSQGLNYIMPPLVYALSGTMVPLPLFPDWLQPFLDLQPFRGLADVPFRIYGGHIAGGQALFDIAQQLGWLALIAWLGRAWLGVALRRVVVQGG